MCSTLLHGQDPLGAQGTMIFKDPGQVFDAARKIIFSNEHISRNIDSWPGISGIMIPAFLGDKTDDPFRDPFGKVVAKLSTPGIAINEKGKCAPKAPILAKQQRNP